MKVAALARAFIAATLAVACGGAATSGPASVACTREGDQCQRDVERLAVPSAQEGDRAHGSSSREGKHAREPKHATHEARVPRR